MQNVYKIFLHVFFVLTRYIATKDHRGVKRSCLTLSNTRRLFRLTGNITVEEPSFILSGLLTAAHCWRPYVLHLAFKTTYFFTGQYYTNRRKLFHLKMPCMLYSIWMDRASVIQVVLSEHNLAVEEGFEQVFNVSRITSHLPTIQKLLIMTYCSLR